MFRAFHLLGLTSTPGRVFAALALVIALGCLLTQLPLTCEEAYTLETLSGHDHLRDRYSGGVLEMANAIRCQASMGRVVQVLAHDTQAPLYYILLGRWVHVAGESLFALRFPSLLAIGACAFWTWLVGVRILEERDEVLSVFMVALLPAGAYYAGIARPYALLLFFTAFSWWALLYLADRPQSRARVFGYAMGCAGGLYTHYLFAIPLCAQLLYTAFLLRRKLGSVLAALLFGFLAFAPWAVFAFWQQSLGWSHNMGWARGPERLTFPEVIVGQFGHMLFFPAGGYGSLLALVPLGMLFLGFIGLAQTRRNAFVALLLWTLSPLAITVADIRMGTHYRDILRYWLTSFPPACLVLAVGASALLKKIPRLPRDAALLLVPFLLAAAVAVRVGGHAAWRAAEDDRHDRLAQLVEANALASSVVVVPSGAAYPFVMGYYSSGKPFEIQQVNTVLGYAGESSLASLARAWYVGRREVLLLDGWDSARGVLTGVGYKSSRVGAAGHVSLERYVLNEAPQRGAKETVDAVAVVSRVAGSAFVSDKNERLPIVDGMPVAGGARLEIGKDARLRCLLRNGAIVELRSESVAWFDCEGTVRCKAEIEKGRARIAIGGDDKRRPVVSIIVRGGSCEVERGVATVDYSALPVISSPDSRTMRCDWTKTRRH